MKRLALIFLSASAMAAAGAAAAQSTVQPPVKWEDTPNVRLKVPAAPAPGRPAPAPGVSWQQPPAAAAPQVRTQVTPAPRPMPQVRTQVAPAARPVPQTRTVTVPAPRPVPPLPPHARVAPAPHAAPGAPSRVEVRRHGPAPHGGPEGPVRFEMRRHDGQMPMAHGGHPGVQRDVIIRREGNRVMRRHHGINGYPDYRRIDRGHMVPQQWWGPRFHVMNWGMYGLPQPMHGGRWVRYYDDALLVDGHGRVHDGRWGMRWDEYQDHWGYDDRGIPIYVGNGDYHPGDRDYGWVEGQQGPHGPYGHGYQQAYGYPGYGYGYGGMVVTETTVTTSPTVVETTVYEDVVQSSPRSSRKKGGRISSKRRCVC